MDLYPSAKNWIKKYFQLVKQGEIKMDHLPPDGIDEVDYLHSTFLKSGLPFGFPIDFLYVDKSLTTSWTTDEKLRVLLFEGLVMVYSFHFKSFDSERWKEEVLAFYASYNPRNTRSVFNFLKKNTPDSQLEALLSRRVHIRKKLTNMLWVNYLSNGLVYLDIIAFYHYLACKTEKKSFCTDTSSVYTIFATSVIQTLVLATFADGEVAPQEKTLLDVFIASCDLSTDTLNTILEEASSGKLTLDGLALPQNLSKLHTYYLIDLAVLVVYTDLKAEERELHFLHKLCTHLNIPFSYLKRSLILIEGFVLANNHKVLFLQESNSYDRLYKSFSRRWIKILGRNRTKLADELKHNQELLALVNKSFTQELTPDEKDKVKHQFREVIKSMPAVAIFMLPGGALLLPIIMRIIPDLVPTAFKKNDLKDEQA